MSREGIEFREGTATQEDIQTHLEARDVDFSPRLSLKVDIGDYSRKINARAQTFEAWFGDTLVGLVAAYMNDSRRTTLRRSAPSRDRKSTRLNSSHMSISYAVFCLKKKKCRRIIHF